jgi:hypothetical protein
LPNFDNLGAKGHDDDVESGMFEAPGPTKLYSIDLLQRCVIRLHTSHSYHYILPGECHNTLEIPGKLGVMTTVYEVAEAEEKKKRKWAQAKQDT